MISIIVSLLPICMTVILSISPALASGSPNVWIENLQLTQSQIEQIKIIENQYADQTNQLGQMVQQFEREFAQSIVEVGSNEQLRESNRELETLKLEISQIYFEKFLAIRDVLTSEQLLKQCEFVLPMTEQTQ